MSIVDAQGAVVASYDYDPYGNVTAATGTLAEINPIRYRGYYFDSESGLYYLQSRYYDPELGRFLNADAFASTGQGILGNNMFVYCLNHPTCRKDILGNTSVEIFDSNGNGLSDDEEFAGSGGNGGNNGTNGNQPGNSTSLTSYYPPNKGFNGTPVETTLEPGSLIQRTGPTNGRFVAPAGTPTETLSLPYNQVGQPTTTYIVNQPISVLSRTAMPWFGSMGGGMQYLLLDGTVSTLLCHNMISLFGG